MYVIKYLEDKSLFYVKIANKVNHKHIISFLNTICESSVRIKNILLVTDYRNATIDETSAEPIEKIGLFVNSKMKIVFKHIKWANISLNPLPTTGALILHEIIKGKELEYQPFTTIEKVLDWMDLTKDDLKNLKILNEEHLLLPVSQKLQC